jgi:hypothetical protein
MPERQTESSLAELRHRPRSPHRPHVGDEPDALIAQQREELAQRTVRMTERDDARPVRQWLRSRFCIVLRTVS